MDLIYIAHPVRPLPGSAETVESNLRDAERWLFNLQRANPGVAFIAPWITCLDLGIDDDADPVLRAQGLARCRAVVGRCTGIALCGPRISRGMLIEADALSLSRSISVFHRFRDREQSLVLEQRPLAAPLDEWGTPLWMQRLLYGSVPVTSSETAMELLAAYEAFADEVES